MAVVDGVVEVDGGVEVDCVGGADQGDGSTSGKEKKIYFRSLLMILYKTISLKCCLKDFFRTSTSVNFD